MELAKKIGEEKLRQFPPKYKLKVVKNIKEVYKLPLKIAQQGACQSLKESPKQS